MVLERSNSGFVKRRRVWREGEQRQIVGQCLRAAYVPEMDEDLTRLMGRLASVRGSSEV